MFNVNVTRCVTRPLPSESTDSSSGDDESHKLASWSYNPLPCKFVKCPNEHLFEEMLEHTLSMNNLLVVVQVTNGRINALERYFSKDFPEIFKGNVSTKVS